MSAAAARTAAAGEGQTVPDKDFATLRARLALRGYALVRSNPADGPPLFFTSRWGIATELDGVAAVCAFVERVGA